MRRLTSLVCMIIVTAVLGSCVSPGVTVRRMTLEIGAPFDVSKLDEVQVGVTDLRDILEWFGPPDFIIDGTQEILDRQGGLAAGLQLPTRTLSAPEGTVILLYTVNLRMDDWSVDVTHPFATVEKRRYGVRGNELMIFVRKRDHMVLNALRGGATHERS